MKLTIESTSDIVLLNGIETRVWKGTTDNGIECDVYVARISTDKYNDISEFESLMSVDKPLLVKL